MEGYHQYSGGLSSVKWRDIFSTVEGAHATWRVIISTVESAEYRGGLSSAQWRVNLCGVEGYHQYSNSTRVFILEKSG